MYHPMRPKRKLAFVRPSLVHPNAWVVGYISYEHGSECFDTFKGDDAKTQAEQFAQRVEDADEIFEDTLATGNIKDWVWVTDFRDCPDLGWLSGMQRRALERLERRWAARRALNQGPAPGVDVRCEEQTEARPCFRCGRPLRSQDSVESGLGPCCAAILGREAFGEAASDTPQG